MFNLITTKITTKLAASVYYNNAETDSHILRSSVEIDGTSVDANRVNIASTLKSAFTEGRKPLHTNIRTLVTKSSKHNKIINEIEETVGIQADHVINYGTRDFIVIFRAHEKAALVVINHGKAPTIIWTKLRYKVATNGSDIITMTFRMKDAGNDVVESKEITSPTEAYRKATQVLNKLRNDMNGDDRNLIKAMKDFINKIERTSELDIEFAKLSVDTESVEAFEETVEVQEVVEQVEQVEAIEPVVINKFKPTINGEGIYVCDGVDYTEVEFDYEERKRVREGARMVINVDIINEFINNRQQFACQAVIIAARLLHAEGGYIAPDYARNKIKSIREELIKQANNHPITGRS